MTKIITLQGIEKSFGKTKVLRGIDLDIYSGEIFGLLGVNGAGKTTLIRALLGLINIDSGKVKFQGRKRSFSDIHSQFGFLPENFLPPKNLKAIEFLSILGWGLGLKSKAVYGLLEQVGLSEHRNKYIKAYSRGMIQRLGLAVCLLKGPEVLVLDEPTLGLDPLGQAQVLELLHRLNKEGKTIFFSSHILSQMQGLCSRVGVIHSGVIKTISVVSDLLDKHKAKSLEEAFLKEIGGA
ncbi:MAG: ABC transporter ATP-binding protein [Candidatus Omnitrophica bacterium]|nr:ABC transporter ATP-binding protein [Candidatus Omnitrophota bacterium]MDD5429262.1 ABC transporter ATP-binding protein [Candidatus Omnitrophota bacterium]